MTDEDVANMIDRFWHDDIEWTEPPTSPNVGTFRGRRAVVGYLRDWMEGVGHSQHTIKELVVAGDKAMSAVRLSVHGPTSGIGFDAPLYFVERVRGGRIDRVRVFYERDRALAALALGSTANQAPRTDGPT
jgi:ketosteroid isomerase-like protein